MKKRTLRVFECSMDHDSNGTVKVNTNELQHLKRVLPNKDVDGSLKAARKIINDLGFASRIVSVNVTTDGNVHVMLRKNPKPNVLGLKGWRFKRRATA